MVTKFRRPRDAAEALAMLAGEPGSIPIAGGTYLLSSRFKEWPLSVVSVDGLLPSGIERSASAIAIGADVTFQDLFDSPVVPEAIRAAAAGMANRHVRNRATVGGNAGANKSCGSLVPLFLVSGAVFRLAGHGATGDDMPAEDWLGLAQGEPRGLIASVRIPMKRGRTMAYRRWSRTACDVSVLTAAVSLSGGPGGPVEGLRIAMGGLGPRARRFPELEALFEGRPLPSVDETEAAIAKLIDPIGDLRGSAAFKRLRASALLADALRAAAAGGEAPV
jgi:putative selenate reductase FAD-binding subunit